MLKELYAIEVYEKFKHNTYLIHSTYDQGRINDLRIALILEKYNLPIPQSKIEHL